MESCYLAVDIGASGGRHILGFLQDGKLVLQEVYRFENGMKKQEGSLCWDYQELFREIKTGMKKCREIGRVPVSMGIDTWGVDYVLLDEKDEVIGKTYAYRDQRTAGMDQEVYRIIPEPELYQRTGIQKQIYNTIYQLMAVKKQEPEHLEKAKTLLMVPDYFHFLLTGNKVSEYTEGTTGQLVDPKTREWDYELIDRLGYKKELFLPLKAPGTLVGSLKEELAKEVGYTCLVTLPGTHDTASAVLAVPALEEDFLYISSGTWSLMGIENDRAICTEESRAKNFTNEGGYGYRNRYLKNIMGLWMIQSVRREIGAAYGYAEICELAEQEKDFPARVDVNDGRFLAPESMTKEIRAYCRETKQQVPESLAQVAAVVYRSLAEYYGRTVREIEDITGKSFDRIHIVGGGSNAGYLNRLTAEYSGRSVYAGPGEATAIGNLAAQMISQGELLGVEAARQCIRNSFDLKIYQP